MKALRNIRISTFLVSKLLQPDQRLDNKKQPLAKDLAYSLENLCKRESRFFSFSHFVGSTELYLTYDLLTNN